MFSSMQAELRTSELLVTGSVPITVTSDTQQTPHPEVHANPRIHLAEVAG